MNTGHDALVLVTGGTGHLASWTIVNCLQRGYRVRTTIRRPEQESRVRSAIATQIDPKDKLSFSIADLLDDAGWDAAMAGVDHVLHLAAPVGVSAPRDPQELIRPTRDGTLRVLRAAEAAGVSRVVMTSAVDACRPPLGAPDGIYDESNWTDTGDRRIGPYRLAKTLGERAAWDFVTDRSRKTMLTTILPGAVLGPILDPAHRESLRLSEGMLSGAMPGVPKAGFCAVDVRDVADLHIRAMASTRAGGERFIAAAEWVWMKDFARILRDELGDAASDVPRRELPNLLVRLAALRDPMVRFIVPLLGRKHVFTSAKARDLLGWAPRGARETIVAAGRDALSVMSADKAAA